MSELALEIALKVRDTLAGLVGRHNLLDREPWVAESVDRLADIAVVPAVLAVIAPPGGLPEEVWKVHLDVLMKRTKQRLAWFTRRVFVVDLRTPA